MPNIRSRVTLLVLVLLASLDFYCSAAAQETAPAVLVLSQPDEAAAVSCAAVKSSGNSGGFVTLHRSFFDDFLGASLDTRKWQTHFEGDGKRLSQRSLPGNHEKEIYVDTAYSGIGAIPLGLDPFKLKGGILSITAARTPSELRSQLYDQPFTSGVITTIGSFRQTHGYFEIRAKIPRGKALWPAFWLLQTKWQWPPEIDILEIMNGQKPEEVLQTTHWKEGGVGAHQQSYCRITVAGDDAVFHLYGALWTSSRIVYYIDRKPVIQIVTPPGLDKPMYMLANLAVQSGADETTPVPASFDINWISAYAQ
jgi:beta-glucanase (GH16 family)